MKIFFFKKSKIGHGGPTQNRILRRTTVTEFSKTFLVFYKWPDLTDVQGILTSTVRTSKQNFYRKLFVMGGGQSSTFETQFPPFLFMFYLNRKPGTALNKFINADVL